jgi:hypothetical protein
MISRNYLFSPIQLPPDVEGVISAEFGNSQPLRVVSVGFLWRAVRYVPQVDPGRAYLAVTINHVISDGKSGLALFNALLAPGPESEKKAPALPEGFPPSMESTIDCRPGYLYMLNVIWKELLIPKLPTFLFNTFKQTPCWPGRAASSHEHRQMFQHIALDAPQVTRLKAMGRKHQVHTLHPILEMAAVVALWQTFAASEIAYDAPISVRDTARGHPTVSGNYVANLESRISCSTDGGEQFWDKTRDFSAWLSSDAGRRQAISVMGMLVHIPDGANDVAPDSPTPTGWETFLLDKMTRAPSSSLEVSNLGYTRLPPHAERVVFAQTPSPFIPPLVINAVGHERGLELIVCWREGTFAYEGEGGADFAKAYEAVLVYLADLDADNGSVNAGSLSFNDIKEAILAHI